MVASPNFQNPRLSIALVLADNSFSAEVEQKLNELGFLAWAVPSAKELYKRLLSDKADILVIDIADRENLDAIKHLASLKKYLITSIGPDTNPNLEIEVLASGADRYLRTPMGYEQLLLNINAMLKYLPNLESNSSVETEFGWQLNSKRMVLNTPNSVVINLTFCEFIWLYEEFSG